MKKLLLISMFYCSVTIVMGQFVGINTTNPRAKLHIAGDFKFTPDNTVSATNLIGTDGNGDIVKFPLINGFQIIDNTLIASEMGERNKMYVGVYDQSPVSETTSVYANLDLGIIGTNYLDTVIRVFGETLPYQVTGFVGGSDGRILYFYNNQTNNVTFKNLDPSSTTENQIITGTGGDESIQGEGVAEFIYDVSLQKWILLNLRA